MENARQILKNTFGYHDFRHHQADIIQAFLSNGRQGINIHPGVWHHYQLTLEQDSDYIVIDRFGPGDNCDEHQFEQEIILSR